MKEFNEYIGLDGHKETIAVSVAEAQCGEVRYFGEISNTSEAIDNLVKWRCHSIFLPRGWDC